MIVILFFVALAVIMPLNGQSWAHGTTDEGILIRNPPKPPAENERLLPKGLPQEAQRPVEGVMNKLRMWEPGSTLNVCFMGASPDIRKKIATVSSEWTKFANLTFNFGADSHSPQSCEENVLPTSNIRIGFQGGPNGGYWSYVGTASHQYAPSLNLEGFDAEPAIVPEQEFRRIVLHEFGHALGLEHEHQSPKAQCSKEIDWEAANQYYARYGWSADDVKYNIGTILEGDPEYDLIVTKYDKKSIMHYQLPVSIFYGGKTSKCYASTNDDLSPGDKQAIALLYPEDKEKQRAVKEALVARVDSILEKAKISPSERQGTQEKLKKLINIVHQETTGKCSPAVANTDGGVTITINGC